MASFSHNTNDISLLRKIALPINLLSFALLTTLGIFIVQSSANSVHNAMQSKATSLTDFIATASAPYLKNYDIYAIDGFAKQAIQDPDVAYMTFFKDGKPVAEAQDPQSDKSEIFEMRREIKDSGEVLGEIRVGFSNKRIAASVREIIWIDGLTIFCEQIVLLIGVFFVTRKVTRPLTHLTETLRRVARSGDYSARLMKEGDFSSNAKEIKLVAAEFDHMLSEIQRKNLEIRKAHDELENKVISRTVELENTIQSLKSTQLALIETSKFAALGEMAGGIAHEINNPLQIISMASSQLLTQSERKNVDHDFLVRTDERLQSGVQRISKIIKGLQSFSRESSQDPQKEESLGAIVQDTLSFCKERFKVGGIRLKVPEIPQDYMVLCRQAEISQVLLNLLNNAYDAATESIESAGWVSVQVEKINSWIQISVSNSGPFISQVVAQRIFDPFFTTKPLGQGTGLGLSISKGIAEAHGGTLSLDIASKFTTFVLCLPASTVDRDQVAVHHVQNDASAKSLMS